MCGIKVAAAVLVFAAILVAVLAAAPVRTETEPHQVQIGFEIILDGVSEQFTGRSTGGQWITPGEYSEMYARGVFWGADSSSGVSVGGIINRHDEELFFELPFELTVYPSPECLLLFGQAYLLNYREGGKVISGQRTAIEQPVQLGEPTLIPVGVLSDGIGVSLKVMVSEEGGVMPGACLTYPVQLVTVQWYEGEVRTRHGAGRVVAAESSPVKTTFSIPKDGSGAEVAKYSAAITFGQALDEIDGRTPVRLDFVREYRIDTLLYPQTEFTEDVVYTSSYVRYLRLKPGDMYRVIIPPDTPSVRGFNIEDTLIIVPPK